MNHSYDALDAARPKWYAEFDNFYDAFRAASELPRGEVFHRMERIAGFCADCEEFEGSADWEGAFWVDKEWLCQGCHNERESAPWGGCGGCEVGGYCDCRGY